MARPDRKKAAEVEIRRQKVAANLLSGLTTREIAAALGVSLGTVSSDRKAITRQWQEGAVRDREEQLTLDVRRLDRALNAIWAKVLTGDLCAIETMRRLLERRARLLGLDAPAKAVITVHAVNQLLELLPPDIRDQVIRGIAGDADPGSAGGDPDDLGDED